MWRRAALLLALLFGQVLMFGPTLPAAARDGAAAPSVSRSEIAAPPSRAACGTETSGTDVLAAAEPAGDLLLASGRRIRLADIRWADLDAGEEMRAPTTSRPGALAWLRSLHGAAVTVRPLGGPDRWGRVPAALGLTGGSAGPIDVAELLVSEGLALVDAGERDALCQPELLGREAGARTARRGLWGSRPLRASDPAELTRRAGRFEVLEGRVVSVGERGERTYLNFGRDFTRDAAVVLPKRSWAALKAAGHSAASLRGRLVRARGIVEARRGPLLEIAAAEMVEVLAEGAGRP